MTEKLPVFVYGTLRPHDYNWKIYLEGRVTEYFSAVLTGYKLYYHDFPFILPSQDATRLNGDLLFLPSDSYELILENLDSLEEYEAATDSGWYLRVQREVEYTDAEGRFLRSPAWVYEGGPQFRQNLAQAKLIAHGDWLRFLSESNKQNK